MYKIGLSSCRKQICPELFEAYRSAGIDFIELSPAQNEFADFDFLAAKKYADEYGIGLWSFHMPFLPFNEVDISSTDTPLRKKSVEWLTELMKHGCDIGIEKFIVHPSGEPIADRG